MKHKTNWKVSADRREYQRLYYLAHQDKAREYQRIYWRTHKKPRQAKKQRATFVRQRVAVRMEFNHHDIMTTPAGDRLVRLLDGIIAGDRLLVKVG